MENIDKEIMDKIKAKATLLESLEASDEMIEENIKRFSKDINLDEKKVMFLVREYLKYKKYGKQKNMMKFYHSTNLDNAKKIIQDGELISGREKQRRNEEINGNKNTLAHGVQFTFDWYNKEGQLTYSGFNQGSGARGFDVTFVFATKLFDEPTFDAFGMYPSIDIISLDKCCAIIFKNRYIKDFFAPILQRYELGDIKLYTNEEWDINIYGEELEEEKNSIIK